MLLCWLLRFCVVVLAGRWQGVKDAILRFCVVVLAGRWQGVKDAVGMRQTPLQQPAQAHGLTAAKQPTTTTEVRYPFGVQNDFGQVILSGGARVSLVLYYNLLNVALP